MQDIRVSLADIADGAEGGEDFIVIRNSKPAFRIVPMGAERKSAYVMKKGPPMTVRELRAKFQVSGASRMLTEDELDALIHEAHEDMQKRTGGR